MCNYSFFSWAWDNGSLVIDLITEKLKVHVGWYYKEGCYLKSILNNSEWRCLAKIQANDGRWTLDVVLSIHDLVLTSVYRRDLFIFAAAVPHWPLSVNSRLAPLNILTVSIDPSVDIRRHPSSSSRHFFLLRLVEDVLANRLRRSLASWALGDQ